MTDPSSHEYLGATIGASNTAELSGFSWAMGFALQFKDTLHTARILYDSEFAAHASDSTWSVGGHIGLARTASTVFNMLTVCVHTKLQHEDAHAELPMNELVDSLCTVFNGRGNDDMVFNEPSPFATLTTMQCEAQWSFVALIPVEVRKQYPYLVENGSMFFATSCCPVAAWGLDSSVIAAGIDDFQAADLAVVAQAEELDSLPLKLVQVNPCTLRQNWWPGISEKA